MKKIPDYLIPAGVILSHTKEYRYVLSRIWDSSKPLVLFIMFNPSTADEYKNDRTITRCMGFAKSNGFGGLLVGNLFAYRSPDPMEIYLRCLEDKEIIGELVNDDYIQMMSEMASTIVFAWGDLIVPSQYRIYKDAKPKFAKLKERAKELSQLYPNACVLDHTRWGNPRHPLYINGNLKFKKFNGYNA